MALVKRCLFSACYNWLRFVTVDKVHSGELAKKQNKTHTGDTRAAAPIVATITDGGRTAIVGLDENNRAHRDRKLLTSAGAVAKKWTLN